MMLNMYCLDDLMKLNGIEPYNEPTNICLGDNIFAQSIRDKYSPEVIEQCKNYLKKEGLLK